MATPKRKTTKKKITKRSPAPKKRAAAVKVKAKKKVKAAKPMTEPRAQVMVGSELPQLVLPATGGRTVKLNDLLGKRIVLYFYPKDSTPGCTLEGHDFTRLHDAFKATNTEVFGISRDSIKSHEKFKSCENYSFELLSDEEEQASKIFGVIKMKNMYGKKVRGIERSTFVIDQNGRLIKEWRGVKVPGHAEEVLNFVKTI